MLHRRRDFLRLGLAAIAAPAIVRATSLMPIGDGVALMASSHPVWYLHRALPFTLTESIFDEDSLVEMEFDTEQLRARGRKLFGQQPEWYGSHGL